MSVAGVILAGKSYKTATAGLYVQELSDKPADTCANSAALNGNPWLAVYLNGARRKPNVFRPAVSDQSLWFSKGETGQKVFDAVLAAWEKATRAGAGSAACQPS
jgi:hypothetical protein